MKRRVFVCFVNIVIKLLLFLQIGIIIFIWINIRSVYIIRHFRQEMRKLTISKDSLTDYFIKNDGFIFFAININSKNVCLLVPTGFQSDYDDKMNLKNFLKEDHKQIHKKEVIKIIKMISDLDLKSLKEVSFVECLYKNEFLIEFIKKYFYYELPCYKYIKFFKDISKIFTYPELNTINVIYFTSKFEINIERIKIKIKNQEIYPDHFLRIDDIKNILNNPKSLQAYENFRKYIIKYENEKQTKVFHKITKRQDIGYKKLCNLYANLMFDIKSALCFGKEFLFPNCDDLPSDFISKIRYLKKNILKVSYMKIKPCDSSFANQEILDRIYSNIKTLCNLFGDNADSIAYLASKSSHKLSSSIYSIKEKLVEFNSILYKYFFRYKKIYNFAIKKELINKELYLFLKKNCEIQNTKHSIEIKYPEKAFLSLWLRCIFN